VITSLAQELARHNHGAPPPNRLRVRAVVHAGAVVQDAHGYVGQELNKAFRLLDSEVLRGYLQEVTSPLVLIVSDAVQEAVVKPGLDGIDPAAFFSTWVLAKETSTRAWIHLPGQSGPPPMLRHRQGASPSVRTPAEIPPDVATFTGRRQELERLADLLTADTVRGPVVISAIHGIGGIGKSALAIHVAHQIADRFSDGQLYVNLHGARVGLQPLTPLEVLGRFLRALGTDAEHIPTDVDEAASRFRSLVADRRLLIILDDARSAVQVRPLLPGSARCAVVITSRHVLGTLDGADHLRLDTLSPQEAVKLLSRLAGAERIGAEPQAAMALAHRCGFLPLALRIAGARLATRPDLTVSALADGLSDEQRRLDELQLDDLEVRATFSISYQALTEDATDPSGAAVQRLFRLLGLLEGPDVSLATAAVLAGEPTSLLEAKLERLVQAQLVETDIPGRYRMHDLLRLFAREHAHSEEPERARHAALGRVLRCYVATTRRASNLIQPADRRRGSDQDTDTAIALRSRAQAIEWLDIERANLLAAVQQATNSPPPLAEATFQLAEGLFWFFELGAYWAELEAANKLALAVARRLGNGWAEGQAICDLSIAQYRQRRFEEAIIARQEALAIARATGHRSLEADVLRHLGNACRWARRLDDAVGYYQQSLALARLAGDRYVEGMVFNNLAVTYNLQERFDEAIPCYQQSRRIAREIANRYSEAAVLSNLGITYRTLRQLDEAITCHLESRRISQEIGSRRGEGIALVHLGELYRLTGRLDAAVAACEEGLAILEQVVDDQGESSGLVQLGHAMAELGEHERARAYWRQALDRYERMGAPEAAEVRALLGGPTAHLTPQE
jgi:tetratricopeptide (TPR) repeat protein